VVLVIFVIGMVVAAALRSSAPDRYARIGQFELSDSPDPHRRTDTTGAQV
jgi:hypothetical protein